MQLHVGSMRRVPDCQVKPLPESRLKATRQDVEAMIADRRIPDKAAGDLRAMLDELDCKVMFVA